MPCLVFLHATILFGKADVLSLMFWMVVGLIYLGVWWAIPFVLLFKRPQRKAAVWGCAIVWGLQLILWLQLPSKTIPSTFKVLFRDANACGEPAGTDVKIK